MTDLPRGSVVLGDGRYGIVWVAGPCDVRILPIVPVRKRERAGDVELAFGELLAAGIALRDGKVRAAEPMVVARERQELVGHLQGPVLCKLVVAVTRAYCNAEQEARWGAERVHRHEAASLGPAKL